MWIVDNVDGKHPITTGNIRDKRGLKKRKPLYTLAEIKILTPKTKDSLAIIMPTK